MSLRLKNVLYTAIVILLMLAVWLYRKNQSVPVVAFEGKTMGTTYHITYFDNDGRNFKASVDSLLVVINKSINNYDSASEVSRFNRSKVGIAYDLPFLLPSLNVAKQVFKDSNGAFDMTVMPLVNAWGFGPVKLKRPTPAQVDSIKKFVGFEKIQLTDDSLRKSDARVQLDFGGIGQGYGADVITDFLKKKGIANMLVELGGEGMAVGKNLQTNKPWEIGVLNPNSTRDHLFYKMYVSLSDKSFTTSGNYFNYYEVDGVKYSHTIDPETGVPANREILSASVFAADCTTADAWGTAFMVMGHEKAIEVSKLHPELEVVFMYSGADGKLEWYASAGIQPFLTVN